MEHVNKRSFTRVPPHIDVLVEAAGRPRIHGRTRDVCMNGLFMDMDMDRDAGSVLPVDTPCQVTILLGGSQERIRVNGQVVRADRSGMALRFTEILGLESYEHLRNLLLHNAELTDQIEKELSESIGLRRLTNPPAPGT